MRNVYRHSGNCTSRVDRPDRMRQGFILIPTMPRILFSTHQRFHLCFVYSIGCHLGYPIPQVSQPKITISYFPRIILRTCGSRKPSTTRSSSSEIWPALPDFRLVSVSLLVTPCSALTPDLRFFRSILLTAICLRDTIAPRTDLQ